MCHIIASVPTNGLHAFSSFGGPHTSRTACSSISLQEIFDMKYFGEHAFGKVVRLCYVSSGLVSVPLVPCGPLHYTVYHSHQFRHKLSLTESDVTRTYDLVSDFFLGAGTSY